MRIIKQHKNVAKLLVGLCFALVIVGGFFVISQGDQHPVKAATCTPNAVLVNPCHALLAVSAGKYPEVPSDTKSQVLYHETRIDRRLNGALFNGGLVDAVKTYHTPGQVLNTTDNFFATRSPTSYLMANWKPALPWSTGNGSSATVDNQIIAMANSIKALAPKKIFLTVHHEPENDVTYGTSSCAVNKENDGTPAQFVAMYRHVHDLFVQHSVTNVVWIMDYMNYSPFDCMINSLYPGDDDVDWIMFNGYGGTDGKNFATNVKRFTDILSDPKNVATNRHYTNKPWGIAEWNAKGTSIVNGVDQGVTYINTATSAVNSSLFPNIKLYMVFDNIGPNGIENRVSYSQGVLDPPKMAAYKTFANSAAFSTGLSSPTPPDTTPPTVSMSAPSNGATVSQTIALSANASDNVGVTQVQFFIDNNLFATDNSSSGGWSVNWDTTGVINGAHAIKAIAFDAAGNTATSNTVTVNTNNNTPIITSFTANPSDVTIGGRSTLSWTTGNFSSCSVTPGGPTNSTITSWQTGSLITNTTFTLTCANNAGTTTKQLTVTVAQAPAITSFSASPATVTVGQSSTLSWATANTATCSVTPGGPTNTTTKSWQTLPLSSVGTITYTLSCKNSAGTAVTATTNLLVLAAPTPPTNVVLTASSTSVGAGGSALLSWSSVGASSCTLNPGNFTADGPSSSKTITNIVTTTSFQVTCSNSAGETKSNSLTVSVTTGGQVQNPTITSFTANPTSVATNGTSTLTWAVNNSIGCNIDPSPLTGASSNGQWTTAPLTVSTAFTLTCKNDIGTLASASVTIIVNGKPLTTAVPPPAVAQQITSSNQGDKTVTSTDGQTVTNVAATNTVVQGDLMTLDPATVSEPDVVRSISKIEFYANDVLISTVTEPPFALDTSKLATGTYTIVQRTYFLDGSVTQKSQIVTIVAKTDVKPAATSSGVNFGLYALIGIPLLGFGVVGYLYLRRWLIMRGQGNMLIKLGPNPFTDPDLRGLQHAIDLPAPVRPEMPSPAAAPTPETTAPPTKPTP